MTFLNWYWTVLDLLIEREWCAPNELIDEAQMIFLEKRDEVELTFQDTLWAIIRADYEEFQRIEDGHINENPAPESHSEPFPEYLAAQVVLPYGLHDPIEFQAANFS